MARAKKSIGDKLVWVEGSNGIKCVKRLSKIQLRTDLEILGDYEVPTPKPKATPKKVVDVTVEDNNNGK